jgi:hypothetical protein
MHRDRGKNKPAIYCRWCSRPELAQLVAHLPELLQIV